MIYLKELKVTYHRKRVEDDFLNKKINNPKQIYKLFKWMKYETREKAVCLHLNPQLEIISYEQVGMGDAMGLTLDIQGIFRGALLSMATSIVIVHNHPHGCKKPSEKDTTAFEHLRLIGELHKIKLQDFLIISDEGYFSFEEEV